VSLFVDTCMCMVLDHLMLTHMETMHKATTQQMMTRNSHMESTTCSTYVGTKTNIQPCSTHMEIKARLAQHTWKSDHHSQHLNQQSMISAIKHKIWNQLTVYTIVIFIPY